MITEQVFPDSETSAEEVTETAIATTAEEPDTSPVKFDVGMAEVRRMAAEADKFMIAGPTDTAGFKRVTRHRIDVVKAQRQLVEKKIASLIDPHKAYIAQVKAVGGPLVVELKAIEGKLSQKETDYENERKRLADEAAKAARVRYETRTKQLRSMGFEYDEPTDSFAFNGLYVLVDDIRSLDDEQYAPTLADARTVYRAELDRLAQIQALNDRTDRRKDQLRKLCFVRNEQDRTYDFIREDPALHLRIPFDDVEQLDDEAYAPIADRATWIYQTDMKFKADRDQQRKAQLKLEARQREQAQRNIDAANAEIARKQTELNAALNKVRGGLLVGAGFVADGKHYTHGTGKVHAERLHQLSDEEVEKLISDAIYHDQWHRDEAQRQADLEAEQLRANEERQTRLAPDKETLDRYFVEVSDHACAEASTLQPETQTLLALFGQELIELASDFRRQLAEL